MSAGASDTRRGGIGVRSAAALVAANMIGAGVFTTSGFSLADLGRPDAVLLAWILGGGIALCGALAYADLARQIPGNGGEYLFLSRALHPLVGFLAGWISLFAGFTAPIAVAAHGLEAYASAAVGLSWPYGLLGAFAILACGAAHGIQRGAGLRIQDIAVATKVVAILGFIAVGAWVLFRGGGAAATASAAPIASETISLPAFAVTLVWISFAYSGWNAAVYVAGELDAPDRTLPRALVVATLGVTLIYVALNAVFLWSAPVSQLVGRAEIGAIAAEALGGPWARSVLSGIVALGLVTSISAMIMVGPRVYAQMAADGLFPTRLAPEGDVPRGAILLQVGLALVAFLIAELRDLMLYVGFLLGISAATTVACLFLPSVGALAESRGVLRRWVVPAIFIVATLGSAGFTMVREPVQVGVGVATLLVGGLAYGFFGRHRVRS